MAAEIIVPEVTQTIKEIVVPQVTPVIDYNLHPIFDLAPVWGWPLWVWVFVAFGILLLFINVRWFRKRWIMGPVLSYLDSLKGGKKEDMQVWMIGKNKSFTIEHMRYNDDGVISYFRYLKNISMWFLGSSLAVGHAGGIKNVIVSDNYDMVRDPVAEAALCTLIDQYNEMNKTEVKDEQGNKIRDENGNPTYKYPITNHREYKQHRDKLVLMSPNGAVIQTFHYFNVMKGQQFMPANRTAGLFGGDNIRQARKKNIDRPTVSNWIKFAPLGIALAISVISILVTYMFTQGFGKA